MVNEPYPRRMEARILDLFAEEPVVQVVGPRACGKSFTCGRVINALGGTSLRLDDPAERKLARADPTGYLAGRVMPVLIDEYQHVPDLKSVIKSRLSADGAHPGQYLLTGSVSADIVGEPERLTGRIHRARLHPLAQIEHRRLDGDGLLPHLLSDHRSLRGWRDATPSMSTDYLAAAVRGGFPLAVDRTDVSRRRWVDDYVQDTVLRDALDHAAIRKPAEMMRLLRLVATRTAQLFRPASVAPDLELTRHTVQAYLEVLSGLFIITELPAWRTNRSQRLVKSPKIHITDTGIAAGLLGLDVDGLRRRPELAGHVVETFVHNEIARANSWLDDPVTMLHFSESERAEVDIVLERGDGGVFGIEVKMADHVRGRDLRGLRRLRDLAGDRWVGGALLGAYPAAIATEDDDIMAIPIAALWTR